MTTPGLANRRPSFPSQSSGNVVASIDSPPERTPVLIKHGKYILVGAGGCWWVDLPTVLSRVLHKEDGWIKWVYILDTGMCGYRVVRELTNEPYLCRRMMLAGLGLHVVTIVSNAFLGVQDICIQIVNAYMCLLILVYFPLLGSFHPLVSRVYPKCKALRLINQPHTGQSSY